MSFNSEALCLDCRILHQKQHTRNLKPINNEDIRDVDDYEHEDIGEVERPPKPSYDEIPKYLRELFNLPEPEPGE